MPIYPSSLNLEGSESVATYPCQHYVVVISIKAAGLQRGPDMSDRYLSDEDAALWASRRALLMGILEGEAAESGFSATTSNGWIFRGNLGEKSVEATLNKPMYAFQFPDTVIVMLRSFQSRGYLPAVPSPGPQTMVTFEPGKAELTFGGKSAIVKASGWLVSKIREAAPVSFETRPRTRRSTAKRDNSAALRSPLRNM